MITVLHLILTLDLSWGWHHTSAHCPHTTWQCSPQSLSELPRTLTILLALAPPTPTWDMVMRLMLIPMIPTSVSPLLRILRSGQCPLPSHCRAPWSRVWVMILLQTLALFQPSQYLQPWEASDQDTWWSHVIMIIIVSSVVILASHHQSIFVVESAVLHLHQQITFSRLTPHCRRGWKICPETFSFQLLSHLLEIPWQVIGLWEELMIYLDSVSTVAGVLPLVTRAWNEEHSLVDTFISCLLSNCTHCTRFNIIWKYSRRSRTSFFIKPVYNELSGVWDMSDPPLNKYSSSKIYFSHNFIC